MLRLPKKLTDNVIEILVAGVLILFLAPVIILVLIFIAAPIFAFESIWSWIRKAPEPIVPEIKIKTDRDSKIVAQELAEKAQLLVKNVTISHDNTKESFDLTSSYSGNEIVHFSYDYNCAGINIDNINSYEWDTINAERLDLFFWIAIAVLRYGAYPARSKFGRRGYWVKCDELNTWIRLQKADSSYDSILFYDKPPNHIEISYLRNSEMLDSDN